MATKHYRHIAALGTLVLTGLSGTALAETAPEPAPEPGLQSATPASSGALPDFHTQRRTWQVEIEPMVWFAAFKGDLTFKDGSTVELEQIGMDEVHAAPAGRFTLRSERWTFAFTAWATSFDDDATADVDIDAGDFTVSAGDRVAFDFDYASFKLTAGYAFDPIVRNDDNNTALWFDLYGGAQVYHMDLEFGPDGGGDRLDESDTWVAPLAGVRMNLTLPAGFEVGVALDAGAAIGGGTGFAWDIVPHFRWFPMENKTVAVEIGFRHNAADLATGDDDDFAFDGFAAGLFASVVIRF